MQAPVGCLGLRGLGLRSPGLEGIQRWGDLCEVDLPTAFACPVFSEFCEAQRAQMDDGKGRAAGPGEVRSHSPVPAIEVRLALQAHCYVIITQQRLNSAVIQLSGNPQ